MRTARWLRSRHNGEAVASSKFDSKDSSTLSDTAVLLSSRLSDQFFADLLSVSSVPRENLRLAIRLLGEKGTFSPEPNRDVILRWARMGREVAEVEKIGRLAAYLSAEVARTSLTAEELDWIVKQREVSKGITTDWIGWFLSELKSAGVNPLRGAALAHVAGVGSLLQSVSGVVQLRAITQGSDANILALVPVAEIRISAARVDDAEAEDEIRFQCDLDGIDTLVKQLNTYKERLQLLQSSFSTLQIVTTSSISASASIESA